MSLKHARLIVITDFIIGKQGKEMGTELVRSKGQNWESSRPLRWRTTERTKRESLARGDFPAAGQRMLLRHGGVSPLRAQNPTSPSLIPLPPTRALIGPRHLVFHQSDAVPKGQKSL